LSSQAHRVVTSTSYPNDGLEQGAMKLRSLLNRGLWPFTPDPAPTGLHTFGSPAPDSPILITGNSRHTLRRLERSLTPISARVLTIDVGGVDVHSALASGGFSLTKVSESLTSLARKPEESSASERKALPVALLPYPAWEALGGEKIGEVAGWRLDPGPADARDLPAYFARGCKLTDEMKVMRFPLGDRLRLALAHARLFVLIAAVPMLVFGWKVFAVGATLALLSAAFLAVLSPRLPGKHRPIKRLVFTYVIALAGLIGLIYSAHFMRFNPLYFAISLTILGMWTMQLCVPVSQQKNSSDRYSSFDPYEEG